MKKKILVIPYRFLPWSKKSKSMENLSLDLSLMLQYFWGVRGDHEAIRYMDHEVECIWSRSVLKIDLETIENN